MDLSNLDLTALIELRKAIDLKILEKRSEAKQTVREEITGLLEKNGLTFADVFGTDAPVKPKKNQDGNKSPIKYRHPQKPDLAWTGRGRTPTWFTDALASGFTRAQMEEAAA